MLTPSQQVFDFFKKQIQDKLEEVLIVDEIDFIKVNTRTIYLLEQDTVELQQKFTNINLCLVKIVSDIERVYCLFLADKSKSRPNAWATMNYAISDTHSKHFPGTVHDSVKARLSPYDEIYATFVEYVENMDENRSQISTSS